MKILPQQSSDRNDVNNMTIYKDDIMLKIKLKLKIMIQKNQGL